MSLTKLFDGVLDEVLKRAEGELEGFADRMILDLEHGLMTTFRRAIRTMVLTAVGAFLLSVSFIFVLVGLAEYLVPALGVGPAWGLAGVVGGAVGGLLLLLARGGSRTSMEA